MAYVIIDLFSRYVVGWMLATKECKHLAAQLFADTIARHGVEPGLTVHADRGSAMKSDTLAQLLASLGFSTSFSRPRISDDNPFSEAQFKTLKYQPDYLGVFDGALHGRAYLQDFFRWHNTTTSTIIPASRSSPQLMSSSTASKSSAPPAKARPTPRTTLIPSDSLTARLESRCRPPRCTLTPSPQRPSASCQSPPTMSLCRNIAPEISSPSNALVEQPATSTQRLRGTSRTHSIAT